MLELVYGGAASGKSEFAEAEAKKLSDTPFYLATMLRGSRSGDERIDRHVARRDGSGFVTIECPRDISRISEQVQGGSVLLECLTNLAANELFRTKEAASPDETRDRILCDLDILSDSARDLIIVSSNLTSDGVRYDEATEAYIRLLTGLNRAVASRADAVYEVVCGCPQKLH